MSMHHPGLLGYGRVPGSLGIRPVLGLLAASAREKPTERIFEPEPVSGWDAELRMTDFAGEPIAFIPPVVDEVRQGRTGNCPVVATLAAMAHAAPDRAARISTRGAKVAAQVIDTRETIPTRRKQLEDTVLYKVRFAKGDPVEVTGLLWNRGGRLEYALSTQGALWPSILEKAYVVAHGGHSYDRIFATVTPYEAMTNILGPVDELVLASNPKTLESTLRQADKRPTVADTLTTLPAVPGIPAGIIAFHTYAVLDLRGNKVEVYNVLDGAHIPVPLKVFEHVFETVVQHRG